MSFEMNLEKIKSAQKVLASLVPPTPLVYNPWLSEKYGAEIYLKLENLQPIGSFKIRGATHLISTLSQEERSAGVIAASAGNHAQGVAWGARRFGVRATIVMPENAPLVKISNTKKLGAEVVLWGSGYDDASAKAEELARSRNLVRVHAFEDERIIAGQGTLGLEIMDQLPEVDAVFASIGGGGMMSGLAWSLKEMKKNTALFACQASGAASLARSLEEGRLIEVPYLGTFADGIAVKRPSEKMFTLLKGRIDAVSIANDEQIASAVLELLESGKTVAEGSAAITLCGLRQYRERIKGKRVVLVISGGNIDVNLTGRIIDRGLVQSGRRLRLNVTLDDRPGALSRLTQVIAECGANVIQAIHDRSEPGTSIHHTEVALTLETSGEEHISDLIHKVRPCVVSLERVGNIVP